MSIYSKSRLALNVLTNCLVNFFRLRSNPIWITMSIADYKTFISDLVLRKFLIPIDTHF